MSKNFTSLDTDEAEIHFNNKSPKIKNTNRLERSIDRLLLKYQKWANHCINNNINTEMKKLITLILLIAIPVLSFSQDNSEEIQETLNQNNQIIEQLSQVAPMSINPYTAVFLTSACSKIGFHNEYVSTNPFYNSWIVLIIFGSLFLFTSIVGTLFSTNKPTDTINKVDDYLQNKAAIIINGVITLLPALTSDSISNSDLVYQAGFISIGFKTLLVLVISSYFLFVIMTVRLFIDFLIFLSPVPFIDSALKISKNILSILLVVVSVISPMTSFIITVIMFIVSLFFLKKAQKLISKVKYLVIYPMLNMLKSKQKVLSKGEDFSILIYNSAKYNKFKNGQILRLEKKGDNIVLIKNRIFRSNIEEILPIENLSLHQRHLDIILSDNDSLKLLLNRSYHKYIDEISETLGVEIVKRTDFNILNKGGSIFKKVKNMFNKNDFVELKSIG